MSKYYYLVAGLPELTLEDSKLSYKVNFGEEEFMNYFKEFLRPQLVEMLF